MTILASAVSASAMNQEISPISATMSTSAKEEKKDKQYKKEGMYDDVVKAQKKLVEHGLLTMPAGASKGFFGPLTQRAISQFQEKNGLPVTGTLNEETKAKLWEMKKEYNKDNKKDGDMHSKIKEQAKANPGGARMASKTVVQNVVDTKNLSTLTAAVTAAGLVETLSGTGPFTVFAPTNRAFAALPAGTVENLLKPENKSQLAGVLTYHVVPGTITSADIKDGMTLKTVQGKDLTFTIRDGGVFINGTTRVIVPDTVSSNGVIHVIGGVLLP